MLFFFSLNQYRGTLVTSVFMKTFYLQSLNVALQFGNNHNKTMNILK